MEKRKRMFLMISVISFFYFILSPTPWGYADILLDVPEKAQQHSQWCWSATSQVTLDYYGTTVSQCEIANWAWTRSDCCGISVFDSSHPCNYWNYMYGTSPYGTSGSLQNILAHWGVNSNARTYGLAQNTAVSEIDAGRPFVMRFGWYYGGGHFLVGYGHSQDWNYLDYMDPWPGNGYTRSLYSWVFSAPYHHDWTHTLQITTNVPPIVTSFKVNNGATSTVNSSVILNNVVRHTPTDYMASENPSFLGASWQAYSTAPSFTLSAGSGTKIVYFKVKNNFVESAVKSGSILALAPAVTSFKINAGALSTTNGAVTLNNVATNSPTHYMASEASDFSGASWQTYSTAPIFTLSGGSGTKKVYFKVKNSFEESSPINDDISAVAPGVTSFKISAGALSTSNNAAVTLNNTATNLPTHYMASEDSGFVGAIWQKYSTAPSFALSSGGGEKKVYFKVKNFFNESAVANDTISTLAPVVTSFTINAGAATTANGKVTLNNVATNSPTHYMASEASDFTGASWQTYSTAPKFTLSSGAGTRTVYFKVRNSFAESNVMNDDISAIGSAPTVTSFTINAGALSTAKGLVTLNNTATNLPMYYMASEASDFSGASWQPYSTAPKFTLSTGSDAKTVYFKAQNIFGESLVKSDTISPLVPVLSSFKINAGAVTTANGKVTLNHVATNSPTHYMASEASDFSGAVWQTYATAPSFNLSDGAGAKTVYFKVKNSFVESNVMNDDISAIGSAPTVTSFTINAGAASTAKGLVTLNNTATNLPMYYMASEASDFSGATWQPYSTAPKFTLSSGSDTKTVYFKVQNIFGESPVRTDTISVLTPVLSSFKVNAGAATTANGKVTLNHVATNSPTHYMASEASDFAGAAWQTYAAAPSFNLSDGAGTKRIYFKVKNAFVESGVASDTISAIGSAPVVTSFKINAGALSTANGTATLNNAATNYPTYYMASEDPNFVGASWQPYFIAPKFTLSAGSGTKTVYFKTMNISGESFVVSDTIFLY